MIAVLSSPYISIPSKAGVHIKNKIRQTYGLEKEIRQWVIHELIDTYPYPMRLIELESKVIFGSKGGAVDVTVNAYQNKVHNFAPMVLLKPKLLEKI